MWVVNIFSQSHDRVIPEPILYEAKLVYCQPHTIYFNYIRECDYFTTVLGLKDLLRDVLGFDTLQVKRHSLTILLLICEQVMD